MEARKALILGLLLEVEFFDKNIALELQRILREEAQPEYLLSILRVKHVRNPSCAEMWLNEYLNEDFYKIFRMSRETFHLLMKVFASRTIFEKKILKKFRGGYQPVDPEKQLLVTLWYLAQNGTLLNTGERFALVPSTVMKIVKNFLELFMIIKDTYIRWPRKEAEFEELSKQFKNYPGTIAAVDGSHIRIKAPLDQQDSYIDRYGNHSVTLMAMCSNKKLFTYVFAGYPGSAHDSRVLSNSAFYKNIEAHGSKYYFPSDKYHIIGDSAFTCTNWLITPYNRSGNLNDIKTHHNKCLSNDRVVIENAFGLLKGRWRILEFINVYSIKKAVSIIVACCVLHNFCLINHDFWEENEQITEHSFEDGNDTGTQAGKQKRDCLANLLHKNKK